MRTIKNWASKARLIGDIDDLIRCLQHPIEREDDENATLRLAVKESGVNTTMVYSERPIMEENRHIFGDGTVHESYLMYLDKRTRDCIVEGLQKRMTELKEEIKDDLYESDKE